MFASTKTRKLWRKVKIIIIFKRIWFHDEKECFFVVGIFRNDQRICSTITINRSVKPCMNAVLVHLRKKIWASCYWYANVVTCAVFTLWISNHWKCCVIFIEFGFSIRCFEKFIIQRASTTFQVFGLIFSHQQYLLGLSLSFGGVRCVSMPMTLKWTIRIHPFWMNFQSRSFVGFYSFDP